MKKALSFIASICMLASAVSITASAEEYENYPNQNDFSNSHDYVKEISDGIKEGRYFGDFDGNGLFDPVDAQLLIYYTAEIAVGTSEDEIDWNDGEWLAEFTEYNMGNFLNNYEDKQYNEENNSVYIYGNFNNEMLENIRKYGDIDGDGAVTSNDASVFWCAYNAGFDAGDVNNDSTIDSSDATDVLQYYSRKSTGQATKLYDDRLMELYGDMNGDSIIDSTDASIILKMYAELSTSN